MSERLQPRRARGSAFAADRTDLEDVTTTTPGPPPLGELMPKVAKEDAPAGRTTGETARGQSLGDRPRGGGGRPVRTHEKPQGAPVPGVSKRPARIPADLYKRAEPLVKGPGKPSWGQLIYWACTTRREAVVRGTVEWVRPADPLAPRGANRAGGVTTPIIPQFLGEEIIPVDEVKAAAEDALAERLSGRAKITATAVVIAALTVATEAPPERGN